MFEGWVLKWVLFKRCGMVLEGLRRLDLLHKELRGLGRVFIVLFLL